MADIINLRRAHKAKNRLGDEAKAAQNRLTFGRAKVERDLNAKEKALSGRRLDDHRLEGQMPDGIKSDSRKADAPKSDANE